MTDIIKKAIEKSGGITLLAKGLNIKHQTIYSWRQIPSERVVDVERITGIPRQELRPDLYAGMIHEGPPDTIQEPAE